MQREKLRLEYIKVSTEILKWLVWPIVVLVALGVFRQDIRGLMGRVESASAPFGSASFSAQTGAPGDPSNSTRPDVWFETLPPRLNQKDCISVGRSALQGSEFTKGLTTSDIQLVSAYTEDDAFVGAIWCGNPDGTVLIMVAGPYAKGLPEKHADLASKFRASAP